MNSMKLMFFALVASLMVVSCDKDEDDGSNTVSVEGNKYETTYVKTATSGGGDDFVVEFDTKEELVENEYYGTMEFKADGVFFTDGEETGTWEQSGSDVSFVDGEDTVSLTVDGDVLKMSVSHSLGEMTVDVESHYTKM